MLPTEDLFVYVYVMIDDAIASGAVAIPPRPGPAPACGDAELLAIAMVRHLLGRRSEAGFLAEVARDWAHLFPRLPHQSDGQPADPLAMGRIRALPHPPRRAAGRPRHRRPGPACEGSAAQHAADPAEDHRRVA